MDEAQRKQAEWAGLVKVSEMHYASTRYQPTVSLTTVAIKNAALSHLRGIWVTDILINKVPVSQHQVCSLHNFSLLEWMEIRCPLPQGFRVEWWGLISGRATHAKLWSFPLFKEQKLQRKELQKAGWGQPVHASHKEWSPNTWVYQNTQTCKQLSGWDALKRWNWGQRPSQKYGKDHEIVNDSGSQPEMSLKSFFTGWPTPMFCLTHRWSKKYLLFFLPWHSWRQKMAPKMNETNFFLFFCCSRQEIFDARRNW